VDPPVGWSVVDPVNNARASQLPGRRPRDSLAGFAAANARIVSAAATFRSNFTPALRGHAGPLNDWYHAEKLNATVHFRFKVALTAL